MSEAGHIGKVVVSFDDKNALVQEQAGASLPIASDATYLVTGGTGGFGLETARWLVDNGARSLVLAARSRTLTAEAEATLGSLRSGGAAVIVVSADVATRAGVRAALAAVERSGRTPARNRARRRHDRRRAHRETGARSDSAAFSPARFSAPGTCTS